MNLQQLEYIVALDRTKNFSKAAESCNITQATLSTMVKKLEEELDLVIFDRKSNPIITTDCGKEIVSIAKQAIYQAHRVKEVARTIKQVIEGSIRVGVIPTIANSLLKIIAQPIQQSYPDLAVEYKEATTENILHQLKDNQLDVGIISTPYPYKDSFEEEILYYEKLFVFGDVEDNREYLIPEVIKSKKIWLLEEGNCLRDQVVSLCALKPKKIQENVAFSTSSLETLLSVVESVGGLTLIPELYTRQLSEERRQKLSNFQAPYPVREVSLVFYRPYAKHRLINLLAAEIQKHVMPHLSTTHLKSSEQTIVINE